MKEKVVVLGASSDPDRYSYKCIKMLKNHQYPVILVHPSEKEILGEPVLKELGLIDVSVHTVTLYVNPKVSSLLVDAIIKLHPKRVIMNPGSENLELEQKLIQEKIEVVRGCSLVMLTTGQF